MRRLVLIAALLSSTTALAVDSSGALKGAGGLRRRRLRPRLDGLRQPARRHTRSSPPPPTALFGSQTFGITTGTSNCGSGMVAQGTRNFVEANREALAKDMSRGQGETIGALTWMAGCCNSQAVGAALQSRYSTIIPSEKASSQEIADKLLETLKADKSLGCQI